MKPMRRWLAAVLAVMMMLTLVACGEGKKDDGDTKSTVSTAKSNLDLQQLETWIAWAADLSSEDFSADSWAVLEDALRAARQARRAKTQEAVDAALENLQEAVEALQSADGTPVTLTPPTIATTAKATSTEKKSTTGKTTTTSRDNASGTTTTTTRPTSTTTSTAISTTTTSRPATTITTTHPTTTTTTTTRPTATTSVNKMLTMVSSPKVGVAYKFGMVQETVNKDAVYFITGSMSGFYMATTTESSRAANVYVEQTSGGYYLYTMVNGNKQYMNMVVNGTHMDGRFENRATTVYTYDPSLNTLVATINGVEYAFGTRSDKNYTTVGPYRTEYDGYYCHFYE